MEELKQTIAKNLINFRTSAGLTQFELAEKINYSDKSISKWERGLAVPDVLVLKQLADLYGVKVDDFFTEGENIKRIELAKTSKTGRHILITLLSAGLVWLVATLCFVVLYWLGIERAWLSFIVAILVCFCYLGEAVGYCNVCKHFSMDYCNDWTLDILLDEFRTIILVMYPNTGIGYYVVCIDVYIKESKECG